jgi:tight adherence protein C
LGRMGVPGMTAAAVLVTVLTVTFAVIWLKGSRHSVLLEGLDYKKHPCRDLYPFGLEVLEMIRYRFSSMRDRKMAGYIKILYGSEYREYYQRIHMARKISVAVPVCIFFLVVSVLIDDWSLVVFAFLAAGGSAWYFDRAIYDVISKRAGSIRRDIPEILTELALLVNAGMVLRNAWRKASLSGEGVLHMEMRRAVEHIDNGIPETEAYREFAGRCGDRYLDRIISAMLQNLKKGNRELVEFLSETSSECWEERKQSVLRKGEEASTKMLLPIGLMFLGILLMIMLPIMGSMSL